MAEKMAFESNRLTYVDKYKTFNEKNPYSAKKRYVRDEIVISEHVKCKGIL